MAREEALQSHLNLESKTRDHRVPSQTTTLIMKEDADEDAVTPRGSCHCQPIGDAGLGRELDPGGNQENGRRSGRKTLTGTRAARTTGRTSGRGRTNGRT